jgi:hypothetical protein
MDETLVVEAPPEEATATARKRRVNDLTRESSDADDPAQAIPFLCECGDVHCYRTLWLTGLQYDAAATVGPLLAAGHAAAPVPALA